MDRLKLTDYHESVLAALRAAFPEVQTVTGANDALDSQELPLPAIVVAITDIEGLPDQDSDGTDRVPVSIFCAATIVRSARTRDLALDLRESAMAVAHLVYGNRWGLGGRVKPAAFLQAGPDEFSAPVPGREAWRVEWRQDAWIGETAWPPDDGPVPDALYSFAPDIGLGHEGDYEPALQGGAP